MTSDDTQVASGIIEASSHDAKKGFSSKKDRIDRINQLALEFIMIKLGAREKSTVLEVGGGSEARLLRGVLRDPSLRDKIAFYFVDKSKSATDAARSIANDLPCPVRYPPIIIQCEAEKLPSNFPKCNGIVSNRTFHHIKPLNWPSFLYQLNERLAGPGSMTWLGDMLENSGDIETDAIHANEGELRVLLEELGHIRDKTYWLTPYDADGIMICRLTKIRMNRERVENAKEVVKIMLKEKLARAINNCEDLWQQYNEAQESRRCLDIGVRELEEDPKMKGDARTILDRLRRGAEASLIEHENECYGKWIRASAARDGLKKYLDEIGMGTCQNNTRCSTSS